MLPICDVGARVGVSVSCLSFNAENNRVYFLFLDDQVTLSIF